MSKWENDQASPDIDILIKLSEIFDISLDELLGKVKPSVSLNDKTTKKDINKMVLKISVNEVNGDKVKVNLPLALVKVFSIKILVKFLCWMERKALRTLTLNKFSI